MIHSWTKGGRICLIRYSRLNSLQNPSIYRNFSSSKDPASNHTSPLFARDSQTRMTSDGVLSKNETEFRFYRKYSAEAEIKYDITPDPLPADKTKEVKEPVDCKDPRNAQNPFPGKARATSDNRRTSAIIRSMTTPRYASIAMLRGANG